MTRTATENCENDDDDHEDDAFADDCIEDEDDDDQCADISDVLRVGHPHVSHRIFSRLGEFGNDEHLFFFSWEGKCVYSQNGVVRPCLSECQSCAVFQLNVMNQCNSSAYHSCSVQTLLVVFAQSQPRL